MDKYIWFKKGSLYIILLYIRVLYIVDKTVIKWM